MVTVRGEPWVGWLALVRSVGSVCGTQEYATIDATPEIECSKDGCGLESAVVVVGVMKGTKLWRCEREGRECGRPKVPMRAPQL